MQLTLERPLIGGMPVRRAPPVGPAAASTPLRILIAEDNAVNQLVAGRMLEKRGHVVTIFENGISSLAAHAGEAFDVILMDVQMLEVGQLVARRERSS